jgi:Kef-type K+ transport system membrane component KefB
MPRLTRAPRRLALVAAAVVALAAPLATPAAAAGGGHGDAIALLVIMLAVILAVARLGGDVAVRLGQPAVLGELLAGVLLGNLRHVGVPGVEDIAADGTIGLLAQLGVLILLFEVGLESTVPDMLKVGTASIAVAVLGVCAPFVLGWGVGALFLPDHSAYVHAFLGATLTATSVGITARVLQDLGRSRSKEARIILGAAVIDDILGLVILAVVGGVITAADQGTSFSLGSAALLIGKAAVFLFGAAVIGLWLSPRLFGFAGRLRGTGILLTTALCFCFLLSWAASLVGLAAIVGAYAAGLILEDVHFRHLVDREQVGLERLVSPLGTFLVPIFFVLMGMSVELSAFARLDVLGLAALLIVAAIAGKQVCALGVRDRSLDRLSIGLGMVPRGEVGLIFANVGLGLTVAGERIVDEGTMSALVIMVIVTTMMTPPALKWSLARAERRGRPGAG